MAHTFYESSTKLSRRLPPWFRQKIPDMEKIGEMKKMFRHKKLFTVCESSHCPNMGKCWGQGVATFMILGGTCTRACRFCAIEAGQPMSVDRDEPQGVAQSVKTLNLRYVVITSVARDDLEDEGASQFVKTLQAIKETTPETKVEVLIPDFSNRGELIEMVVNENPVVMSHNVETVKRLSSKVRPQADYQRSLDVLKMIKKLDPSIYVKSSIMVGLGETREEIKQTMCDLVCHGCDVLTIGQYLAPSEMKRHLKVERFITPEEFESYKDLGREIGLKHVMSGPLVRSSFLAEEGYNDCLKEEKKVYAS